MATNEIIRNDITRLLLRPPRAALAKRISSVPIPQSAATMPVVIARRDKVPGECCRNAAVALSALDNLPFDQANFGRPDDPSRRTTREHYRSDKLSKGLPVGVHLTGHASASGNVTATHVLPPIFAALLAYNFIIVDDKGNGVP